MKKIINPNINLWECFNGHELKSPFEILYKAAKPIKNNVIIKPNTEKFILRNLAKAEL